MKDRRLWSLFDLVEFNAQQFINVNGHLADLDGYVLQLRRLGHRGPLNSSESDMIRSKLDQISPPCTELHLFLSIAQIGRVKDMLRGFAVLDAVSQGLSEIRNRIVDEMRKNMFLAVTPDDFARYKQTEPFGSDVASYFSSAIRADIEESSKCLALNRYTACVFHLMRVMEHMTQRLGTVFGVLLVNEKNWQNILDEANKAIRKMPYATPEEKAHQAEMGQLTAHLFNVTVAWRNNVMHPKSSYTDEEARDVFSHVEIFTRNFVAVIPR